MSVKFPKNWDEDRVRGVLEHYETQMEDAALEEDEERLEVGAKPCFENGESESL